MVAGDEPTAPARESCNLRRSAHLPPECVAGVVERLRRMVRRRRRRRGSGRVGDEKEEEEDEGPTVAAEEGDHMGAYRIATDLECGGQSSSSSSSSSNGRREASVQSRFGSRSGYGSRLVGGAAAPKRRHRESVEERLARRRHEAAVAVDGKGSARGAPRSARRQVEKSRAHRRGASGSRLSPEHGSRRTSRPNRHAKDGA